MKKVFNGEQVQFIIDNALKMTYKNMSELKLFEGLTEKQIRNKARNIGIKKTRTFNDKYFDEINKKEKAYFLGFIYADGYLTNYGELGIELNYDDKYILEKLNAELGGVHKIKERKRKVKFNGYNYHNHTASLRIYSKKIENGLQSNGITYNKTEKKEHPVINEAFFQHFLRGYFDGDGCVYKHNKYGYNMVHFTCSNENFLKYLLDSIEKIINVQGKIYKEKSKKYRLMYYRKEDSIKLLNYIYNNSENLRLERKYLKHL